MSDSETDTDVMVFTTVEQFRASETPEQCELHVGEIVPVTPPAPKYVKMHLHLRRLLERALSNAWVVSNRVAYRPMSEYELWRGDVVAISKARWDAIDPNDDLHGTPELVIDARSPLNRPRPLAKVAAYSLATGCISFWVVDMDAQNVTTMGRDGKPALFEIGDEIPLILEPGHLPVSEIFASGR
jgi:Uma2 family endonuclease